MIFSSSSFPAVLVSFVLVGAILQVLLPTYGHTLAARAATPDPMMARSIEEDISSGIEPASATAPAGITIKNDTANAATTTSAPMPAPTNVQLLGISLYSQYSLSLELAGILLTIALVGAVIIARKNTLLDQPLGTGKLPTE